MKGNQLTNPEQKLNFTAKKNIPSWRFWLPLFLQSGILLSIPIQPLYTSLTGKTVILQTIPVDPYDVLRGYSQTLRYDISQVANLQKLSGWQELIQEKLSSSSSSQQFLPEGTKFYAILEAPQKQKTDSLQPWKAIKISSKIPENLSENQVALAGKIYYRDSAKYGLETYYLPEGKINQINQDINNARWGKNPQSIVVEIKVDRQGKALPISFWIGKQKYQY